MRRGEIRMIELDPVFGSEVDKVRPAVIVRNRARMRQYSDPGSVC